MPAYSISIAVINLSTSSIECRKDAMVERRDWASALGVALGAIIEELPDLDSRRRAAMQDRIREILQNAYTSGPPPPDR